MDLVFLHGPAAVGKLTVGRELARLLGARLFHNHLVVDALTTVFEFGSPPFVELREAIWLSVFREAARREIPLVFTFAPERTVTPGFARNAIEAVESEGGRVVFVELTCPLPELEKRMEDSSRAEFGKLRSLELFQELTRSGAFEYPPLPEPLLTVDTSTCSPAEAAARIVESLCTGPEAQAKELIRAAEELIRSVEKLDRSLFLGPLGRWSARDVVAHLIGWNRYTIEGAKQIARGELPFYDVDPGEDFANVNRVHLRDYPAREPSVLLAELETSAKELADYLRPIDAGLWSRDHGVRHRGETVTIRSTVEDLIADYHHHRKQIEELAKAAR